MARTSWFDDKAEHQAIQERVSKLDSFTSALADGVVSGQELTGQEQRLVTAMKKVESELNDDQHSKVTTVLAPGLLVITRACPPHEIVNVPK